VGRDGEVSPQRSFVIWRTFSSGKEIAIRTAGGIVRR
jgi:hypothetical protein